MANTNDRPAADVAERDGTSAFLSSSIKVQSLKAAVRAGISGYVDAYSLINFGVFASFMSGNTTSGAVRFGQRMLAAAAHDFLPIPFFLLGILVGTLIVQTNQARALYRLTVLVGALLTIDVAATYTASRGWLSMAVLSTAMGMLNTSVTRVGGQSVSLGFITGDLNNLARHIALAIGRKPVDGQQSASDTHWRRVGLLAALWTAFVTGGVLGAVVAPHLTLSTLLCPALLLLLLALIERPTIARA